MLAPMKLSEYIQQVGDDEAARLFEVKRRTVQAWRRGERTPRREQAHVIVERSPVTFEGIYSMPSPEAVA